MPKQKNEKRECVTRTQKWEIHMGEHPGLEEIILKMGDGLREYQQWALSLQEEQYRIYKKLTELLATKLQLVILAKEEGVSQKVLVCSRENLDVLDDDVVQNIGKPLKGLLTDFDLYALYAPLCKGEKMKNIARASIPSNWVLESVFRKIFGAYKSFFTLRERGDVDAHTIRMRKESEGELTVTEISRFIAIQGALSKGSLKGSKLVLAPKLFPDVFEFLVPGHQLGELQKASRLAKFVVSRDERDLRKPGRYFISVSYEIEVPETTDFLPEEAVYVALGASCIGIISPKGEEVIKLWRPDAHWGPEIEQVENYLRGAPRGSVRPALQKGSLKWQDLVRVRKTMFQIMANQQTLNRREVVIRQLVENEVPVKMSARTRRHRLRHGNRPPPNDLIKVLGHGRHFVVTDLVVRSKDGKLADASQTERGGMVGLNWSVQNTGSIGLLVRWLEEKVKEHGGTVRRHVLSTPLPDLPPAPHERKIPIAKALRDDFLRAQS